MRDRGQWLVLGLGALLIALCATTTSLGRLDTRIPLFLCLFVVMFAAYLVVVFLVVRKTSARRAALRSDLIVLFAVAALARIVLIPATPTLSTDAYRYLWEGRIIAEGFNPFNHPPDAPELRFLRDENYEGINHKELETIYPPFAQAVFTLSTLMRAGFPALKAALVLFDLLTVLLLFGLLRTLGRDPRAAVIYAWNPMVMIEVGHSGHVDPVGICAMVLAVWLILRGRRALGLAALGVSFLAKYIAVVFAPFFLLRRRFWLVSLAAVGVVAVGYLPFLGASTKLVSSLQIYGMEWKFNGLAFTLLSSITGNHDVLRFVLAGMLVAFAFYQAARRSVDLITYAVAVVGAMLLLAPTLYPWYVCWIVPLLCVTHNRAWILFTGLVMSSYWVWVVLADTGEWVLPNWVLAVEYVPFLALLVFDAWKRRGHGEVVSRACVQP